MNLDIDLYTSVGKRRCGARAGDAWYMTVNARELAALGSRRKRDTRYGEVGGVSLKPRKNNETQWQAVTSTTMFRHAARFFGRCRQAGGLFHAGRSKRSKKQPGGVVTWFQSRTCGDSGAARGKQRRQQKQQRQRPLYSMLACFSLFKNVVVHQNNAGSVQINTV